MLTDTYGLHLMLRLDGIQQRDALNDADTIATFLDTLVRRVNMRVLAGPMTGREEGGPERLGVSGVVILYESHAAIHTYPLLGGAFVDIFSCRLFDQTVVLEVFEEFFGAHRVREIETLNRGRHWETDIEREQMAWSQRR